jgi:hypothetical protein
MRWNLHTIAYDMLHNISIYATLSLFSQYVNKILILQLIDLVMKKAN